MIDNWWWYMIVYDRQWVITDNRNDKIGEMVHNRKCQKMGNENQW